MAAQQVTGLTTAKINGKFYVDVKNSRWNNARDMAKHKTQGGKRLATGIEDPSGSFEEVISPAGIDWRSLKRFSIEIFDKLDKSKVIASFTNCEWGAIGGSTTNEGAMTTRNVTWEAEETTTV